MIGLGCNNGPCQALSATAFYGSSTALFQGVQRWPDIVVAAQWNIPNGVFYASGMVGQRMQDNGMGVGSGLSTAGSLAEHHADTIIWAASLSGRYNITPRFEIGGQGYVTRGYGDEINGPPMGANDVVLISQGCVQGSTGACSLANHGTSLKGILGWGVVGYAQVKLTDTIRATGSYAFAMQNVASLVPNYYGPGSNKAALGTGLVTNFYWAAHANILWNPIPQVTFGAEYSYQYASKYNGPNINGQRLQLAAIYRF